MTELQKGVSIQTKAKYATRVGKVLSKPSSAGGFSTALVYKSDNPEEQKHGGLYFIIDISSTSPLSPDIAYNLIDIVKEEYYRDLSRSPAQSFESALKSANEEFTAIAKEGEKSWIGKTNITIAAITSNKLLAVQRGTSEMHLWRNGKIMHLSEGMYTPGETHRPEETLTNIIEGELSVGDKLILSTAELFYYLSVEKLKRIVEGYSPAGAAQKIAQQLQEEEDITKTNVVIIEFSLPELIDFEEETAPEDNWIGKEKTEVQITEIKPKTKSLFGGFSARIRPTTATQVQPVSPSTSEMAQELEMTEASLAQKTPFQNGTPQKADLRAKEKTKLTPDLTKIDYGKKLSAATSKIKSIAGSPELKRTGNMVLRYLKYAGLIVLAIIDLVANSISNWADEVKKRPHGNRFLMITVGVLAIIMVISTLSLARSNTVRVSKKVAIESLESAIQKRDAARAAIIYEDNTKASTLLFEAYGLAESATRHDFTKTEAIIVLAEVKSQLDEVGKTKRFENPRALIDFSSLSSQIETQSRKEATITIDNLLVIGTDVYTYDTEHNKVFKYNDSRREAGIVNSLVSKEKKLKLGTVRDNELIFYANPASIYILDLDENRMRGVALDSGSWNNANDIIAYTDKLYFLDTANNNIWKYKQVSEGYTKIAPYFEADANVDLTGATDFAIDGNIYILNNGIINKYTMGQQIEYIPHDVPEYTGTLGTIRDIYTSTTSDGLYVLDVDNSRVVVFDKDGNYLRQYIFTGISNPSTIFVDEAEDYLWILSDTQVYQLEL